MGESNGVDVLAWLDSLHATMPDGSVTNRKWPEAQAARAVVAELIEASKAVDHALQHSGHFGVMEAVTRMQHALARCGGAR